MESIGLPKHRILAIVSVVLYFVSVLMVLLLIVVHYQLSVALATHDMTMANMYADIVLVCIALYICFVVVYFEVLRRRRLPSRSWKQIIASTLILLNGFVAFCGLLFSLDVPLDKLDGWSQFVQSSSWYPKAWLLDLSLFMLYGSALMCSVCMVLCDRQPT